MKKPSEQPVASLARFVPAAGLLVVGMIHLLPFVGVAGGERLNMLYGIQLEDPNLSLLMRHRAVLFGLLGAFLVYAAFRRALQPAALIAGFISVLSFIGLALVAGPLNDQLKRVWFMDQVAVVCLVLGGAAYLMTRSKP